MKNKKICILAAAVIAASALMTGCETGTIGDNPPKVSANPITEKFTFKDEANSYKIVFNSPWKALRADDEAYDIAFVSGESEEESPYKISVRREETTEETDTLDKARQYYTVNMYGIKKSYDFKLKDIEGIWTTCSSAAEEGLNVSGLDVGDEDNGEPYYELGVAVKDSEVFIIKYEPKNADAADEYRDEAMSVLEGIDFTK